MFKIPCPATLCVVLAASVWAQGPEAAQRPALRVGMAAPELHVLQWLKGEPVAKLEQGHVYVVECWATWCGPCKQSIPHLTDLAKKYADKVTVIGVSVWERPQKKTNEAILATVKPFVEKMGDQMGYRVAVDDVNRTMANAWLRAAGKDTIPNAFIVGKDRRIAWLGHPLEMDPVLEAVVAGTFDVDAEARRLDKAWQEEQELKRLTAPMVAAYKAKDDKAMVQAVDQVLAARPDTEGELMPVKFEALARTDETAAFAYLKACVDKGLFKAHPVCAYEAATVVNRMGDSLKKPDQPLLVQVLEQAISAGGDYGPLVLATYAQVLANDGRMDQAIQAQQKAIQTAQPLVGKRVSQTWVDTQKKTLAEYEAKKSQKP